ncbi:hypothetical protein [Pontibaca methylaminivorans]|uniref:hypothetical protein n=1 Tax=Pontibaca methylaminivorans TaxID=515897 RepID=UPI00117FFCF0|nr:hypothetical protein [Pontibaca methylaminivorans]
MAIVVPRFSSVTGASVSIRKGRFRDFRRESRDSEENRGADSASIPRRIPDSAVAVRKRPAEGRVFSDIQ